VWRWGRHHDSARALDASGARREHYLSQP
jgi:hypothetical protein